MIAKTTTPTMRYTEVIKFLTELDRNNGMIDSISVNFSTCKGTPMALAVTYLDSKKEPLTYRIHERGPELWAMSMGQLTQLTIDYTDKLKKAYSKPHDAVTEVEDDEFIIEEFDE